MWRLSGNQAGIVALLRYDVGGSCQFYAGDAVDGFFKLC